MSVMSDQADELIDNALEGIDRDALYEGWWETSAGVEHGKSALYEVKTGVSEIIYELESQLNFMKFIVFWAAALIIVLVSYIIFIDCY